MSKTRRITWIALAIVAVMFTIHVTLNGLPSLSSLNPHAR